MKNTATKTAPLDTEIVHEQREPRRVDVELESPNNKIARERLTGYHAMSHSVMVMAMCVRYFAENQLS